MGSISGPMPLQCLCTSAQHVAVVYLDKPTDSCLPYIQQLYDNACVSTDLNQLQEKESKTPSKSSNMRNGLSEVCLNAYLLKLKQCQPHISKLVLVSHKPVSFIETMQYVNCMHRLHVTCDIQICAALGSSYLEVLPSGYSKLTVNTGNEGKYCGLIPLGHPNKVTTTGLKWNLDDTNMEFSDLVSTSNALDGSGKVSVQCDYPLLWYLDIQNT